MRSNPRLIEAIEFTVENSISGDFYMGLELLEYTGN